MSDGNRLPEELPSAFKASKGSRLRHIGDLEEHEWRLSVVGDVGVVDPDGVACSAVGLYAR